MIHSQILQAQTKVITFHSDIYQVELPPGHGLTRCAQESSGQIQELLKTFQDSLFKPNSERFGVIRG